MNVVWFNSLICWKQLKLIGCLCCFVLLPLPVFGNDLQIEDYSFVITKNGQGISGVQLAYLSAVDVIQTEFTLANSWQCEVNASSPDVCLDPPDFIVLVQLVAVPESCRGVVCQEEDYIKFDFSPVAVSGATEVQDRPHPSISTSLDTTSFKTFTLDFSATTGFNSFVTNWYDLDYFFALRLTLDYDNSVAETDATGENNNQVQQDSADFIPLSGRLSFGPTPTILTSLSSVTEEGGLCGTASGNGDVLANLQLHGGKTLWNPSPASQWGSMTVSLDTTPFCAAFHVNAAGDGFDLTSRTVVSTEPVAGQLAGLAVTIDNNTLDPVGGASPAGFTVELPTSVSYHQQDPLENGPLAAGVSNLTITSMSLGDPNNYSLLNGTLTGGYLHAEGLPFSLGVEEIVINDEYVAGFYNGIHYVYDRVYHSLDPRVLNATGPTTNDRRFSLALPAVEQATRDFYLNNQGLHVTGIDFAAIAKGKTHFPRTTVQELKDFSVTITKNRLLPVPMTKAKKYDMATDADCASCDTGGGDAVYAMEPLSSEGLGVDGSVLVKVGGLVDPFWGPGVVTLNGGVLLSEPDLIYQLSNGWTFDLEHNGFSQTYDGPGYGVKRIFQRIGDSIKEGVLYFPGDVALGTGGASGSSVVEYLLGMRCAENTGTYLAPGNYSPLGSITSRRGNCFMGGLTVGPEYYSQVVDSQPLIGNGVTLEDTGMSIGFGGKANPDFQELGSSIGTKYVVRSGGITGAFNFDSLPQPKVYGYTLDLTRFAFRIVNNIPDEYSWMDGSISIPGRGGFNVAFESLELECSGDIGKGLVARESRPGEALCSDGVDNNNNGFIDENCSETLNTWNTAIDLLSLDFQPKDSALPVCTSQERDLTVGNTVDLKALNKPLGMLAKWTPDGDPFAVSITGHTDQVIDQPKDVNGVPDPGKPGFRIALQRGVTLQWPDGKTTDGWFAMDGDIGVPFWNALTTSTRVANKQGDVTQQEQTIIIARGKSLTGQPSTDNTKGNAELADIVSASGRDGSYDWDLQSTYEWGSTGFSFSLPVLYETGRHAGNKQPRFIGRSVSKDLVVLDANAGIDWIVPEKTKVSFGASADFTRLSTSPIDLEVDLSDPESIAKLDNFLQDFGVTGDPVATLVGELQAKLNLLHNVADAGLDNFLEQGVDAALSTTPMTTALTTTADTLGTVQAVPERLASEVKDGLMNLTSEIINPLSATLDSAMVSVYESLPELYLQAELETPDIPELEKFDRLVDHAIGVVGEVQKALGKVDGAVDNAKEQVQDLTDMIIGGTDSYVKQAETALDELQDELALAGNLTQCNFASSPLTTGNNALLDKVGDLLQRIEDVKSALDIIQQGKQLVLLGERLASVAGIDLSALDNAQQSINVLVEEVQYSVDQAFAHLNDLCSSVNTQIGSTLADANELLVQLKTAMVQLGAAQGKMEQARDQLLAGLDNVKSLTEDGSKQLGKIVKFLQDQQKNIDDAKNGFPQGFPFEGINITIDIQNEFDKALAPYQWYYPLPHPHSFVEEIKNNLRQPIDEAIASAVAVGESKLRDVVSLVPHPSAQDLRDQLKGLILNSEAVETIENVVNKTLDEAITSLTDIGLNVFDQLNMVVQDIVQQLEDKANEALQLATSELSNNIPVQAAKVDGYAVVSGDELERLHVGAEWTMSGDADDNTTSYAAALDVTSWSTNNKGLNCLGDADITGLLDAMISVYGVPVSIGESDATIDTLYLGFTLENLGPVGIFGGISLDGDLDFKTFVLYDLAFAAGVGQYENYLGASGGALFDDIQMKVAFLVGKTCNTEVLQALDPQVAEFINLPGGVFNGAYLRGAASIPIYSNGCALTVGVSADAGAWVLAGTPYTLGGLIGGGAYGKVACIASLRGQVTLWGQKSGNSSLTFGGEGFGGAGIGSCDPGTWTSVDRIRADSWCGTGDASFGAHYDNGFTLDDIKTSAID